MFCYTYPVCLCVCTCTWTYYIHYKIIHEIPPGKTTILHDQNVSLILISNKKAVPCALWSRSPINAKLRFISGGKYSIPGTCISNICILLYSDHHIYRYKNFTHFQESSPDTVLRPWWVLKYHYPKNKLLTPVLLLQYGVVCVIKPILIAHAQDLNFVDGGISFVNSEVEFL